MANESSEAILTWNAANWITVVLMVLLGFAVIGMTVKVVQRQKNGEPVAA